MHLTLSSDYALRILLFLGAHPDEVVPVSRIISAYRLSPHHVTKVAKELTRLGYVKSRRGVTGGLLLNRAPAEVRVGEIVRVMEPHLNLLECFDLETNACPIVEACELKEVFSEAKNAFLAVLDRYTVEDLLRRRTPLVQLFHRLTTEQALRQAD